MKRFVYLLIVLVLGVAFLASCSSSSSSGPSLKELDGLDNPQKFDYFITIHDASFISIWALNEPFEKGNKSVYSLKIDGQSVELDWDLFAEYLFIPGLEYEIELTAWFKTYKTKIKIPHKVMGEISRDFNPAQDFNLAWQVAANNSLQFVSVDATDMTAEDNEYYIDFEVPTSARQYTIKANSVKAGLENYCVSVNNVNYKTSGKAAFVAISYIDNEEDDDDDWKTAKRNNPRLINSIINAIN